MTTPDETGAQLPFLVVGGGEPSDAQRHAIGRALRRVREEVAGASADRSHAGAPGLGGGPDRGAPAAWRHAALLEATTGVRITEPGELPR